MGFCERDLCVSRVRCRAVGPRLPSKAKGLWRLDEPLPRTSRQGCRGGDGSASCRPSRHCRPLIAVPPAAEDEQERDEWNSPRKLRFFTRLGWRCVSGVLDRAIWDVIKDDPQKTHLFAIAANNGLSGFPLAAP